MLVLHCTLWTICISAVIISMLPAVSTEKITEMDMAQLVSISLREPTTMTRFLVTPSRAKWRFCHLKTCCSTPRLRPKILRVLTKWGQSVSSISRAHTLWGAPIFAIRPDNCIVPHCLLYCPEPLGWLLHMIIHLLMSDDGKAGSSDKFLDSSTHQNTKIIVISPVQSTH